jgi:replication factor C subunit 3/5
MSTDVVGEEAVYQCTGNPLPKDIEAIVQALFNEDFVDVFDRVQDMQLNKGLALTDIVQQLHPCAPAPAHYLDICFRLLHLVLW